MDILKKFTLANYVIFLLIISLFISPIAIANTQSIGIDQGQSFSLNIPENSIVTEIMVYSHDYVDGLKLKYRTVGSDQHQETKLIGNGTGKMRSARLDGTTLDKIDVWHDADGIRRMVIWSKNGAGYEVGFFIPGTATGTLRPTDSHFWGFSGTLNNNIASLKLAISGSKVIARQTAAVTQNIASTPIAQSASDGFNPFAENVQANSPNNSNPFGNNSQGTSLPIATQGLAPIARRPGSNLGNSNVPFSSGSQNDLPVTEDPKTQFDGVWVEINAYPRRVLPAPAQNASNITVWEAHYISPRMINITGLSPTQLFVENVNMAGKEGQGEIEAERGLVLGSGQFVVTKKADNIYSSQISSVSIKRGPVERQDIMNLSVKGAFGFLSGQYRRATLPDNLVLSRDRNDPETMADRPKRSDKFANIATLYEPSLVGYDIFNISPLQPNSGRKGHLFEQHGAQDYSFDDKISIAVPYGLRGIEVAASENDNAKVSVTSEQETQKQMSMSMGASILGFGANFSKEKTQSARQSVSSSLEITFARIPRYALVLDLPNMELNYFFRHAIEGLINGDNNYEGLLSSFGTHYANAVTYGGLGFVEEHISTQESADSLFKKWNASGEMSDGGKGPGGNTGANFGSGNGEGERSATGISTSSKKFRAVGGSGTFNEAGWVVNDDHLAPIMYDLRPISELINPILFPTEGKSKKIIKLLMVRQKLQSMIKQKLANAPRLSNIKPKASRAYRVSFQNIRCTSPGSHVRSSIKLSGEIVAKFNDSLGSRELKLFSSPVEETTAPTVSIACGPKSVPMVLTNKQMVLIKSLDNPVDLSFGVKPNDLYDYVKPTYTDEDNLRMSLANDFSTTVAGVFTSKFSDKTVTAERKRIQLKASTKIIAHGRNLPDRSMPPDFHLDKPSNGIWLFGNTISPSILVEYKVVRLQ